MATIHGKLKNNLATYLSTMLQLYVTGFAKTQQIVVRNEIHFIA